MKSPTLKVIPTLLGLFIVGVSFFSFAEVAQACNYYYNVLAPYGPNTCAIYAGQYGSPPGYTVGEFYFSYNDCDYIPHYSYGCSPPASPIAGSCSATHYNCNAGTLAYWYEYSDQWQWWCYGSNGGSNALCVEQKPCTNIYSSASCSQYAGQYGIPSNYTVGTANYYYNSCTYAVTYYGGCTAPAAPTASITINGSHNLTIPVGTPYTWNWSSTNGTSWSSSYTSNDPARCGSGTWVANNSSGSNSSTVTSALAGCQFTVNYTVSGLGGTVTDTAYATIPALPPVPSTPTVSVSPSSAGLNQTLTASWATSGATSYNYKVDNIAITTVSPTATSWVGTPASMGFTTAGQHKLEVQACNIAGCSPSYGRADFTVVTAPTISTFTTVGNNLSLPAGGGPITLTWSSINTTSCTASNGWSGTKPTSGSETIVVSSTATYDLTCY